MLNNVMKVELIDLDTKEIITLNKDDYDNFYYSIKVDSKTGAAAVMELRREFKPPFPLEKIALKVVGKEMQLNLYLDDVEFVRSYKVSVVRYNVVHINDGVGENLIMHMLEQL